MKFLKDNMRKGFTLLELVVVMALATLLFIPIPGLVSQFFDMRIKNEQNSSYQDVHMIFSDLKYSVGISRGVGNSYITIHDENSVTINRMDCHEIDYTFIPNDKKLYKTVSVGIAPECATTTQSVDNATFLNIEDFTIEFDSTTNSYTITLLKVGEKIENTHIIIITPIMI